MRRLTVAVLVIFVAACAASVPPAPAPTRTGTQVSASFNKTWNAVVDQFAERNIQIKTIDKASGLIVAEPSSVGGRDETLADCGTVLGIPRYPTDATWNVLVRGDSTVSKVKATVRFVIVSSAAFGGSSATDCSTKGKWEAAFEESVKQRAEAKTTGATR